MSTTALLYNDYVMLCHVTMIKQLAAAILFVFHLPRVTGWHPPACTPSRLSSSVSTSPPLKGKQEKKDKNARWGKAFSSPVSFRSPVTKTSNHQAVATVSTRNSPPFHTPVLDGFCESRDQNLASNAALVTKPQSWQFCFFDRKKGIEHTLLSILEFSECVWNRKWCNLLTSPKDMGLFVCWSAREEKGQRRGRECEDDW